MSEDSFGKIQIFQGAPGGGKTSLFRVFTPSALLTLYRFRIDDDYHDLYGKMESLDIISENGPNLLGVLLSCAQSYAMLEDLDVDAVQKERLLYSLLNVRIMLATLRGAITLRSLEYPESLEELQIEPTNYVHFPDWLAVPVPCSGKQLSEWATRIEENICEAIDSFDSAPREALRGHDTLYSLQLLGPEAITYNREPIANRVLIMLDDVHKLTLLQRQKLFGTLLSSRWPVTVWIAERLDALMPDELLSSGATVGRDYETVRLEDYWGAKQKPFEAVVTSIADKRARLAPDFEVGSFTGYLEDTLDDTEFRENYETACRTISNRLRERFGSNERYKEWFKITTNFTGTPRERAIEWQKLEILIERHLHEMQLSLPLPLSSEELDKKSSPIQIPAELFIAQEFKIPFYFGISSLAILASSNIEQFLDFCPVH